MQLKIYKKNIYSVLFVYVGFIVISLLYFLNLLDSRLLLIYALSINVIILFKHKKNTAIYIIFFMFLSVILYLIPTYFFGIPLSEFRKYNRQYLFDKTLFIQTFFLVCFYIFSYTGKEYYPIRLHIKRYNSSIVFWSLFGVTMFSILFLFKGNIMLGKTNAYAIYKNNLMVESGLPEYLIIFLIIMFIFGKSKYKNCALIIITLLYTAKLVLLGYRVQSLAALLFIYFAFFDGKFKQSVVVGGSMIGMIAMLIFGKVKDGIYDFSLDKLFFDAGYGFVMSHQTNMYYSSTVYLGFIEDGILNLKTRMVSSIGFILNTIIPSKYIKAFIPEGQLAVWGHNYTPYGGGGLPAVYFYVWFGIMGVLILAIGLSKIIKATSLRDSRKKHSVLHDIMALTIIITSPRWIFYDPGNFLFRIPIYIIILYVLILNFLFRRKQQNHSC